MLLATMARYRSDSVISRRSPRSRAPASGGLERFACRVVGPPRSGPCQATGGPRPPCRRGRTPGRSRSPRSRPPAAPRTRLWWNAHRHASVAGERGGPGRPLRRPVERVEGGQVLLLATRSPMRSSNDSRAIRRSKRSSGPSSGTRSSPGPSSAWRRRGRGPGRLLTGDEVPRAAASPSPLWAWWSAIRPAYSSVRAMSRPSARTSSPPTGDRSGDVGGTCPRRRRRGAERA